MLGADVVERLHDGTIELLAHPAALRHAALFNEIAATGGLLSEYPPGTPPRGGVLIPHTVLDRRNRRLGVMRSEVVHEDGRLIATAVGSYTIFPRKR